MGHLARDIEVRHTPSGTVVGNSAICVNNMKKGGEKDPCFIDFTCFGKTAEAAAKYLSKGSAAYIEGNLEQQKWKDKNTGAERTKHAVIARVVQFVGSKGEGQQSSAPSSASSYQEDDIPFAPAPSDI